MKKKRQEKLLSLIWEQKIETQEELCEALKNAGFDSIIRINGDYDSDGKVTAADARSVLRESVGLEG